MTLVKFNPYVPTQHAFGDLFNELFNNIGSEETSSVKKRYRQPAVNIIEKKDMFILELAVPGINKKDIDIQLEKNELIISSNLDVNEKEVQKNYVKREYSFDSFKRIFTIPKSINKNEIDALHENGVLTLTLMKREEDMEKGPVTIKVK